MFTPITGSGKRAKRKKMERFEFDLTRRQQRERASGRAAWNAEHPSAYVLPAPWKSTRNITPISHRPSPVVASVAPCTFSEHDLTTCITCNPRRPLATDDVPPLK